MQPLTFSDWLLKAEQLGLDRPKKGQRTERDIEHLLRLYEQGKTPAQAAAVITRFKRRRLLTA